MLTDQQRQKYELARQMAEEELENLDKEINAELARTKERLLELQQAKKAVKLIYDGACARMDVKSVIEMKEFNIKDLVKQA
jgi:signal-transduction protein with cAMP-binding, CBS, and nucleotidyltransferase domain